MISVFTNWVQSLLADKENTTSQLRTKKPSVLRQNKKKMVLMR